MRIAYVQLIHQSAQIGLLVSKIKIGLIIKFITPADEFNIVCILQIIHQTSHFAWIIFPVKSGIFVYNDTLAIVLCNDYDRLFFLIGKSFDEGSKKQKCQ